MASLYDSWLAGPAGQALLAARASDPSQFGYVATQQDDPFGSGPSTWGYAGFDPNSLSEREVLQYAPSFMNPAPVEQGGSMKLYGDAYGPASLERAMQMGYFGSSDPKVLRYLRQKYAAVGKGDQDIINDALKVNDEHHQAFGQGYDTGSNYASIVRDIGAKSGINLPQSELQAIDPAYSNLSYSQRVAHANSVNNTQGKNFWAKVFGDDGEGLGVIATALGGYLGATYGGGAQSSGEFGTGYEGVGTASGSTSAPAGSAAGSGTSSAGSGPGNYQGQGSTNENGLNNGGGGDGGDPSADTSGTSKGNSMWDYVDENSYGYDPGAEGTYNQPTTTDTSTGSFDQYGGNNPNGQGDVYSYDSPSNINYQQLAQKYGPQVATQIMKAMGGGGGGKSVGGGILDTIGNDPLQAGFNSLPFLLALYEADRQSKKNDPILARMSGLADSAASNQGGMIDAAVGPYDRETMAGRDELMSSQASRGVRGSSFGDQGITSFDTLRGRGRGELVGGTMAKSLGLQGGLLDNLLKGQTQAATSRNLLLGAGLSASGSLFKPQQDPFGLANLLALTNG